MRRIYYIFAFLLAQLGAEAQLYKAAADTEFFYGYGGGKDEEARSIKEIPGGGYIIAGTTSSFGQGNTSVYLIKTDKDGKHLWSNPYGGALNDHGQSLEVTADSGYFVAGFSNSFGFQQQTGYDAYYLRTDKNGNQLWQKTIAGDDWDFLYGSTPMSDGGFILCGETYTNSKGGSDAYLVRINKNGDTLWTHRYGGLFDESFNAVTVIYNQIYAVGKNATHATDTVADAWLVKLDTNGNILKDTFITGPHHYEEIGNGITPYAGKFFHFCGQINVLDSSSATSFLYRADTAFNLAIIPNYFSTSPGNSVVFNKVINTSYGDICVVGSAIGGWGGNNVFWIGYDANMQFITDYARHSGGPQDEFGYDGIRTSTGRLIAVGSENSFCSGSDDVFLVRFNTDTIANLKVQFTKNTCYTDTLFLWAANIHQYNGDLKISLYPNPVNTKATIVIKGGSEEHYQATVFSLMGNQVLSFSVDQNLPTPMDVSTLAAGTYLMQVRNTKGELASILKFVVEK